MYWSYQSQVLDAGQVLSTYSCPGCLQTMTLSFATPASNISFALMGTTAFNNAYGGGGYDNIPLYLVEDNYGHSATVQGYIYNWPGPATLNAVSWQWPNITQLTITPAPASPGYPISWEFAVQNVTFGETLTVLDPVPDLLDGSAVTTERQVLALGGRVVSAVATDSAARIVLRVTANHEGDQFTLTASDDQGGWTSEDGYLATIQGVPSGSSVQVTAVDTRQGPMAFAQYFPPPDFARSTGQDNSAGKRLIHIQYTSLTTGGIGQVPLNLVRPPVVLVHGLWGDPSAWDQFRAISSPQFSVSKANYSQSVSLYSSIPSDYSDATLAMARANSLGFSYNAPKVLQQIQQAISEFRMTNNAAGAQADIVAHSMGGLVVRALVAQPLYTSASSFGRGAVHKLITIGSPHLGSPLATQLLIVGEHGVSPPLTVPNNDCVRQQLAERGKIAFLEVTLDGEYDHKTGALGDLQGDGWGGGLRNHSPCTTATDS